MNVGAPSEIQNLVVSALQAIEKRLGDRLDALESSIDDRLEVLEDAIESRLGDRLEEVLEDAIESRMDDRLDLLETRMKNGMDARFQSLERRMETRFDRIDVRLNVRERHVLRPDDEDQVPAPGSEAGEREQWRCLPTDVLPKVCDFVGPVALEMLAATSRMWQKSALSCSFWSVLDKERFGLHLDKESFWMNRRDRAWKLRLEDRNIRIDRSHFAPRNPTLRRWSNPAMRFQALAETGRLALVRDVDFSFFLDARLTEEEVRRVIKAAHRLESVHVASEGARDKFTWLNDQLDALLTSHRNPESLETFCLTLDYHADAQKSLKDGYNLILDTKMTRIMTKFPNIRRASFQFQWWELDEHIWSVDVLLNTIRRLWTGITHFHWNLSNAIPSNPTAYQAALRGFLDARRSSLRSLGLFGDDLYLSLQGDLPTSLEDLEIGPVLTQAAWSRLRECVQRDRLPNLRFLHVLVVTDDDIPEPSDSDDPTDDVFGAHSDAGTDAVDFIQANDLLGALNCNALRGNEVVIGAFDRRQLNNIIKDRRGYLSSWKLRRPHWGLLVGVRVTLTAAAAHMNYKYTYVCARLYSLSRSQSRLIKKTGTPLSMRRHAVLVVKLPFSEERRGEERMSPGGSEELAPAAKAGAAAVAPEKEVDGPSGGAGDVSPVSDVGSGEAVGDVGDAGIRQRGDVLGDEGPAIEDRREGDREELGKDEDEAPR